MKLRPQSKSDAAAFAARIVANAFHALRSAKQKRVCATSPIKLTLRTEWEETPLADVPVKVKGNA